MNWVQKVSTHLDYLQEMNTEYPLGNNFVYLEEDHIDWPFQSAASNSLKEFYASIREVHLPDIYVGYFISRLGNVAENHFSNHSPVQIEVKNITRNVISFGSTGGGDIFCIAVDDGSIILIPSHGVTGAIIDGSYAKTKIIADSFTEFLAQFLADVEAFTSNQNEWKYMVD